MDFLSSKTQTFVVKIIIFDGEYVAEDWVGVDKYTRNGRELVTKMKI